MQQVLANCMNRLVENIGSRNAVHHLPKRGIHEEMEQYFADIRDGKCEIPAAMAEAMCYAAIQAVAKYMSEHEHMRAELSSVGEVGEVMTADHERHKKFKKIIEQLRDEPMISRKKEIIDANFAGLNSDETNVLLELATDNSKSFHAQRVHMDVDAFERVKHEAERKLTTK